MDIRDLKVGDKVFIRKDLIHLCTYGKETFNSYIMPTGLLTVESVFPTCEFITVKGGLSSNYSSEMIDWEKTKELNQCEFRADIERMISESGTFKKIIQSGDSKKETTKGITYDGTEIIVKNNGEENDIEKAVMLLMLKQRGVTYSDVKREVEKVKVKWEPKQDEKYYWINEYLEINWNVWEAHPIDKLYLGCGNCFGTREEAGEKLEKIKEVLKGE